MINHCTKAMKYTRPGLSEHELFAFIEFQCRKRGAQRLAYVPVIAGGHNSLILHYINNDCLLQDGDLVLVDAGAEYQCYATDITRTWPVNGKFTKAQLDVYNAVLDIQQKCILAIKEGRSIQSLHHLAVQLTSEKLASLGIPPHLCANENLKMFFPHNIGHYLGMDVHDVSTVSNSMPLRRGMVVTVEPGLYFPVDNPDVPPQYRGIGVRIEDDVLVTPTGPEVLTHDVPKLPHLIEELMQQTMK
jgi:Xaa-Pro aminopeptidase